MGRDDVHTASGRRRAPEQRKVGRKASDDNDAPGNRETAPRLRLVVVAEPGLVSTAVAESLGSRGLEVATYAVPTGPRALRELGHAAVATRSSVGVVVSALDDPAEIRGIDALLAGVPLRWLVVTSAPVGPQWGAVLEAGAAAVLPTGASLDDLRRAVLWVTMGREVMPPTLVSRVLQEWHETRDAEQELADRLASLTPRELAVLNSLSEGLSVKAIAAQVGVSEGTVRSQVKSILRKLGVRSQLAGVALYQRLGELRRRGGRPPHQQLWSS